MGHVHVGTVRGHGLYVESCVFEAADYDSVSTVNS